MFYYLNVLALIIDNSYTYFVCSVCFARKFYITQCYFVRNVETCMPHLHTFAEKVGLTSSNCDNCIDSDQFVCGTPTIHMLSRDTLTPRHWPQGRAIERTSWLGLGTSLQLNETVVRETILRTRLVDGYAFQPWNLAAF